MRTLLMVLLTGATALAQQQGGAGQSNLEKGTGGERPWAKGVSEAEQKVALALFHEGNLALKEPNFPRAVQKYRDALAHWDHPAIHYNLAVALLNLDQPVETHEQFVESLKFGAAPLDADKFEKATAYEKSLAAQLAGVDIRCNMEGASVKLDGKLLYVAPGRYTGFVTVGPHSIVATKEGYMTNEISMPLKAGEPKVFELNLLNTDDLTEYKRLWPTYVPYLVLGAGIVVAVAGGLMQFGAFESFNTWDNNIKNCQATMVYNGGCHSTAGINGPRDTGNALQDASYAGYAVGGVLIVVGAVLAYQNRLQPYHISTTVSAGGHASISLLPFVGPNGGGAALSGEF